MNTHLSEDQFESCVLGQAAQAELDHLNDCPGCRAEFEHFGRMLSLVRSAVRNRIEAHVIAHTPESYPSVVHPTHIPKWSWAVVAAAFIAVIMSPFLLPEIQPQRAEPVSAETSPEAIMERLNRHLSRAMPGPMEPVLSLIPSEEFSSKTGGVQ
jgi:hypothetical protein